MNIKRENHLWNILLILGCLIGSIFVLNWLYEILSLEIQLFSARMVTVLIGNFVPLGVTCLLILYELNLLPFYKKQFLLIKEDNLICIPSFHTYISIFECTSFSNLYIDGLGLLNGLNRYSIEIFSDEQRLRIYLYSDSKIDMFRLVKDAQPLVETVFPNIYMLTSSDLKTEFQDYSLDRRGEYRFIQQGKYWIIPTIEQKSDIKSPKSYTDVYNFLSPKKPVKKNKLGNFTQLYSITKTHKMSFFDFFGFRCFSTSITHAYEDFKEDLLYRAIIRFYLVGCSSIFDKDGITNIQRILTSSSIESDIPDYSETSLSPQSDEIDYVSSDTDTEMNNKDINPICVELCNISRGKDEITVKAKKCSIRSAFSKKLLVKQNLSGFLNELVNGEDDQRRDDLLSDLFRHMSFHQIYCLIVHFLTTQRPHSYANQIIQLFHILIQKRLTNIQEEENVDPNTLSIVGFFQQRLNQGVNLI